MKKKKENILSWTIDISLAKFLLPILKEFKKEAFKVIDFSEDGMFIYEKFLFTIINNDKFRKYLLKKGKERFEYNFSQFELCLQDILDMEEDNKDYSNRWNIKPLYNVEYNHIRVNKPNVGILYNMEIKPEYLENHNKNKQIIKENNKQLKKRRKWQRKCFYWFANNLSTLWW